VGDLLSRWTNRQLRSVLHRAVPPQSEATLRSRYSATVFYEPRHEVVISCLEPSGPDEPALFPPITAGEHLAARRRETTRSGYQD